MSAIIERYCDSATPVRKGGEIHHLIHHLMVMVAYYLVIQLGSLGKLATGLGN